MEAWGRDLPRSQSCKTWEPRQSDCRAHTLCSLHQLCKGTAIGSPTSTRGLFLVGNRKVREMEEGEVNPLCRQDVSPWFIYLLFSIISLFDRWGRDVSWLLQGHSSGVNSGAKLFPFCSLLCSEWCSLVNFSGGRDFPGGSVVKTSPSNAGDVGSIPGRGAKIPHASRTKKPKYKTEAIW